MSTITRERLEQLANFRGAPVTRQEEQELARIALASREAEPVFEVEVSGNHWLDAGPVDDSDFSGMPDGVNKLYSAPPAPVSVPDECYQHLSELYHAQEKRLFKLAQRIKGPSFDKYAYSPSQAIDVLESAIFGESAEEYSSAAMLNQEKGNG